MKRRKFKSFFLNLYRKIANFFCDPFIRYRNYKLCERYPFLSYENLDTPRSDMYKYTVLDEMPNAWRKSFGIQMCEEIRNELIKFSTPHLDWLKKYSICEIKEKYGTLRWYDNGTPAGSLIDDIVSKYEDRSMMVCIKCGRPAKYCTDGWISYVCKKHFKKIYKKYDGDYKAKEKKCRIYQEDIPCRMIWKGEGKETIKIPSPYDAEMRKLWPDHKPKE